MNDINEAVFIDALTTAYCQVAPARLANKIKTIE
jgi:hypothetical protein